jgi:hypothetical protein
MNIKPNAMNWFLEKFSGTYAEDFYTVVGCEPPQDRQDFGGGPFEICRLGRPGLEIGLRQARKEMEP